MRLVLCSGVSCFGTHLTHNFLNNRCSVATFCNSDCWHSWRWISINAILCAFKNFITDLTSQSARGSWNKRLHLQMLQWCYCENSESPASACVMRRHYSITYRQWLRAINCLRGVRRGGNILCGGYSYYSYGQRPSPSIEGWLWFWWYTEWTIYVDNVKYIKTKRCRKKCFG